MFGRHYKQQIEALEKQLNELKEQNHQLEKQLEEKKELFHPKKRKIMTVSPYIFEKYIIPAGNPVVGGYQMRCTDGSYYIVHVDEEMSDGYIRYEEPFEEPHKECKTCGTTFKLIFGYPTKEPDFCSHTCYKKMVQAI